jgi:hypothetical protein
MIESCGVTPSCRKWSVGANDDDVIARVDEIESRAPNYRILMESPL